MEQFGVRQADALIADAPGIADYYQHQFGVPTELIRYGAPVQEDAPTRGVEELGLSPGDYHLVVARFEPENHVLEIVQGYSSSTSTRPLVVVGAAPYAAAYTEAIHRVAEADSRIRMLGGVYDQDLLNALYFHAHTYLHGQSVGGTNPSLLRAMGAGYFNDASGVMPALNAAERDVDYVFRTGFQARVRVGKAFS